MSVSSNKIIDRIFGYKSKRRNNPDKIFITENLTSLTFSAQKTKTDACANNVDPDETARNEPSHQYLHCLLFSCCFFCFFFLFFFVVF